MNATDTLMTRCRPLFLGAMLLFSIQSLYAQERRLPPFVLGLGAGYDVGSGVLIDNAVTDRGYDQSSALRQGNISFIMPKVFMDGWGLTAALTYGDLDFTASGSGARTVYIGGAPTTGTTSHDYRLLMRLATLELMTHIHLGGNARLELGPIGGAGFLPEVEERERILSPADATFSDGSIERADTSSDVNGGMFIAGFGLRAGYEIPFFGGLALLPVVNLRALAGIDGDGKGIALAGTAGLGLSLLSGRTGGEPAETVPVGFVDTLRIVDTVAAASRLRAELDLYSIDSAGRRSDTLVVALRRTLRRIEVPLETKLRFEAASAALPSGVIANANEAARFSEEDLVAMRPAEIRGRSLEVIGARLRDDRSLRITVTGTRRRDEPAWFAEARARGVRSYLQSIWGIDSARVAIGAGARTATGELPMATITSGSVTLLAPVVSEWLEQEVDAAPVGVQPTIVAAQGVQSWRVSVMQAGREVGVVRNTDEPGARQIDIGMALRRLTRDEARSALGAELVVEDSTGAVTVARDRMEIIVAGIAGEREESSAEAFVGEYLVPMTDTLSARRTLERLVMTLPVDARITVGAPIGHDADGAWIERAIRALTTSQRRSVGVIERVEVRPEEALDEGLMLVRVRGKM